MVLKVVSTPARFWERGALCFVERFALLGQITTCTIFWRIDDSGFKHIEELYRKLFKPYVKRSIAFPPAVTGSICHVRLWELEGRLEVIGSLRRSEVRERHGAKSLTARNSAEHLVASVIWSRADPRFLDTVRTSLFTDYSVVC